ncbi:hypothetical protein [Floccifex sp.]|uniref:hypothetical protein n=1 Tax=Floccifex sp. TaxID=2815810 RepID=UPI0029FF3937|nr:hypothetical protein [Floccifex sp.]MDD7282231.1 hypothetical protein [Erysipelotrichaceae bacterium]MDY2957756.1 hypothetical protein [Floccifex sp.]
MNKEELKKNQPIVYQTLSNALKYNRLAHAYLFTGAKGSIKSQTALLFAQSLVCEHPDEDGFACQECDTCKRMAKEESNDFCFVHGDQENIKKDHILNIIDKFSETAQEVSNKRIYILDRFDNANNAASNKLLKFLEEPGQGIYAILTADEKSNLLPTIQSRCQIVTFRPISLEDELKTIVDEKSAKMLAMNGYSLDQVKEMIETEEYEQVKQFALDYMNHWDSLEQIVIMQTECFIPKSKYMDKKWVRLWIQWLLFNIKEKEMNLSQYSQIQMILVQALDALRIPVDLALLLDQTYNKIRKVVTK